ncbi:MAG: hypothetical protein ACK2U9_05855, partial [Anaerolineae bacterium]
MKGSTRFVPKQWVCVGPITYTDEGRAAMQRDAQNLAAALAEEPRMHCAYLAPLDFRLPAGVETFHDQGPALARQFADEKVIGQQPADFRAQVEPLLAGPLSEPAIEATYQDLGKAIEQAAAAW